MFQPVAQAHAVFGSLAELTEDMPLRTVRETAFLVDGIIVVEELAVLFPFAEVITL